MVKFKFGKRNASSANAKSRTMIFFVVIVIIIFLLLSYILYKRHGTIAAVAGLTPTPGIESIPGAGKASTEYVKLQEKQNIQQAQQAEQAGGSAVPTITRTSYVGPSEFQQNGTAGIKPGCSPDDLNRARIAGVTIDELQCKACTPAQLRAAGFTAGELAAAGYNPANLRAAGYSAADLRAAGFTPAELKAAGFTAQQLAAAGYNPMELSQAGYSAGDIANAGFNPADLAAAGLTAHSTANVPKDCSAASLQKAHSQGVLAADLKKLGCGAAALRAAGYTAADLRAAGFTPEELRAAGFSPADLRAAGLTAGQLRRAGLTPPDLKAAGFSPADLKNAGLNANALRTAGFAPNDLASGGFTNGDLLRSGFNPSQIGPAGLSNVGLSPAQIAAAKAQTATQCSPQALQLARSQGVTASDLRQRGCGAAALLAAGYSPAELKAAGFTDDDLRAAGVSPTALAATAGVAGGSSIPPMSNSELQLSQVQANQEQQLNQQQRDQKMTQVQASMVAQANALFSTWTPPPTQQYVAGEPPKEQKDGTGDSSTTTAEGVTSTTLASQSSSRGVVYPGRNGSNSMSPLDGPDSVNQICADVKAGDIAMGVLLSTVNSDENSPVQATVVSGPLRGAKLIGQFTLLKEKVLINFNKIDMPGKPASMGINAVAIDPQTAQTALADCVNNHYWLRYGTLFASSFLSGLADAISSSGSQVSTGAGGILVTHDKLSSGQTLAVALGAVGSQYASVLGSNFTRPPTVHVYAGDSIGVLFMQDLTIPEQCCPPRDKTCHKAVPACVTRY